MLTLVHHFLTATAAVTPVQRAIVCGPQEIRFGPLCEMACGIARTLQRHGVRRGDRVVLFLENSIEMVASVFGTLMSGGVIVPIHPGTKPDKLSYLLGDCEPRAVIAQGALAHVLQIASLPASVSTVFWAGDKMATVATPLASEERSFADAAAEIGPIIDPQLIDQDLAAIIYTSGSTGDAKGVMLTHHNLCNTSWAISRYLDNRPSDIVLCALPLSFDYGLYQVLTGARIGFTVVLEHGFAFPWQTLERIAEQRVTGLPGVPTLFATLLQFAPFPGLDLSSLRYLTNTGAALPPAHIRALREAFTSAKLFSMYGLTECTRVSWLPPEQLNDKITSVGKPMPNCEAFVVDDAGRRLPPGQVGELVVRGSNLMRGYWRKPDATARRLRDGEIAGEKQLHTGDLFQMDEDGFLYFLGRRDDVFKCRGQKVSPKEIENALCDLPGVAEAAVIGISHPIDGMAIKALVVPRSGVVLNERQVRMYCRSKLESGLVPRFIEICSSLPRSENGKVRKRLLAEAAPRQASLD